MFELKIIPHVSTQTKFYVVDIEFGFKNYWLLFNICFTTYLGNRGA